MEVGITHLRPTTVQKSHPFIEAQSVEPVKAVGQVGADRKVAPVTASPMESVRAGKIDSVQHGEGDEKNINSGFDVVQLTGNGS